MKREKKLQTTTETAIGYDPLLAVVDVKYSKVLNICFSLTDKTDNREIDYAKQRQLRGFDDSETWSLTDTICHFILPRLQRFKEINASTPAQLTEQEWNDILDKIITSLQLTCKDKSSRNLNDEESKQKLSNQMKLTNPKYTLREWHLVWAYQEAQNGNYKPVNELQEIMTKPYEEQTKEVEDKFYIKKPDNFFGIAGISHVSCSS